MGCTGVTRQVTIKPDRLDRLESLPLRTRPTGDASRRARATLSLSPDEQRERAEIKKAKLQLKDTMLHLQRDN